MKYHRIKNTAAAICISMFATGASADGQFEQRLAETKARLNLTEAQIAQVKPVLELNFTSSRNILDKYGVNPENRDKGNTGKRLRFKDARKLAHELKAVRADTLKELSGVLTDDQLTEYREIQTERAAALRQRIRESRNSTRG